MSRYLGSVASGQPQGMHRTRQAKSWATFLAADRRNKDGKAPFPGLYQ